MPTSGRLWGGVRAALQSDCDVVTPDLPGFGAVAPLADPTPAALAAAVRPLIDADTHLVGHDLGGLLAALLAAETPVRSLTLCSTALGPGWLPSRLTALPPWRRFFYRRYAGRRWLAMGVGPAHRDGILAAFPGADPARMEAIARRLPLKPPPPPQGPVSCLWGGDDRSFPLWAGRRQWPCDARHRRFTPISSKCRSGIFASA